MPLHRVHRACKARAIVFVVIPIAHLAFCRTLRLVPAASANKELALHAVDRRLRSLFLFFMLSLPVISKSEHLVHDMLKAQRLQSPLFIFLLSLPVISKYEHHVHDMFKAQRLCSLYPLVARARKIRRSLLCAKPANTHRLTSRSRRP